MKRYCSFVVDGLWLGVPVERVQEVMRSQRMTRVPLAAPAVAGLINLRGQIVTALDLRRRLALPPPPDGATAANVVIRTEDGGVSLLVDEIGGVLEVDEATVEEPPRTTPASLRPLVTAVAKLPDRLLLLLDVERVLQVPHDGHTTELPRRHEGAPA